MTFAHRSSLAKFRCGVAPLRTETGRYKYLPVHERKCPFCKTVVESELHVLLNCPMYTFDRQVLVNKALSFNSNFSESSETDKLIFLFNHTGLIRILAKTVLIF